MDKLYTSYAKTIPFGQYVLEQKENGKWGDTLDMCFVSIVYGVNIISVSNTIGGLKHFCVYEYFRTLNDGRYIVHDPPTIWIYHHLHKRPFVPSGISNHFGSLWPVDSLLEPIYRGQLNYTGKRKMDEEEHCRKKNKIVDQINPLILSHFEHLGESTSKSSGSQCNVAKIK